jgi:hypothetical protein
MVVYIPRASHAFHHEHHSNGGVSSPTFVPVPKHLAESVAAEHSAPSAGQIAKLLQCISHSREVNQSEAAGAACYHSCCLEAEGL